MQLFLIIVAGVVVAIAAAGAVIYYTGNGVRLLALFGPRHGWDLKRKAPPPDYANSDAWAALPGRPGPSAYVPSGVEMPSANPPVDVFFIHPTGYIGRADWNSPLDMNSQTEENTQWMMANVASVFNSCCAVYAPRYRQASLFRYIGASAEIYKQSGDFAYGDVDRAFTYFLEHYSKGRPFIIAGHSQGTEHGWTLVRKRIDGTDLAKRMVAAYLIGGAITDKEVATLKTLHACASPTDLHCVIHWATYREGSDPVRDDTKDKLFCVNPLTWLRDGALAPASMNKGAVPLSGQFLIKFWAGDRAQGHALPPLKAPLKDYTSAECRNGFLFARDQSNTEFAKATVGNNYHGLDYALFAMDIRENVKARVAAFRLRYATA